MTDLIIGAVDGYRWDQIKFWANSIKMSGFSGEKVVIAFRIDAETTKKLTDEGFEVHHVGPPQRATSHLDRFVHIWDYLQKNEDKFEYVITTDVRDVVFQYDPSNYFQFSDPIFVCASENVAYKDEAWGDNNLRETFGDHIWNKYRDRTIYNVGAFGGQWQLVQSMCLLIAMLGSGRPNAINDQAVFNFILAQEPWASMSSDVYMAGVYDAWALHCGTLMDPTKDFSEVHVEDVSDLAWVDHLGVLGFVVDGDTESKYVEDYNAPVILHQYDRVPAIRAKVEAKYG